MSKTKIARIIEDEAYLKDKEEISKKLNGVLTTNKQGFMLQCDDPNFSESLKLIDRTKVVGDFSFKKSFRLR